MQALFVSRNCHVVTLISLLRQTVEPNSSSTADSSNTGTVENSDLVNSVSNAQRAMALLNPSLRKTELSMPELEELYANLDAFLDCLREARGSKVGGKVTDCVRWC